MGFWRTRIPQTMVISSAVGTIRKMIAWRRNVIPLESLVTVFLREMLGLRTSFRGQSHASIPQFVVTGGTGDPSSEDVQMFVLRPSGLHAVRYWQILH